MTNPENQHPQDPTPPQGPRRRPGDPRRLDKTPSNNVFWYLMLAVVIVVVVASFMGKAKRGKELKFSEFIAGLEQSAEAKRSQTPARFNRDNVFELTIGANYITFQDQPASPNSTARDNSRAITYYHIAAMGMDEDKTRLTKILQEKGIEHTYGAPPPEWQSVAYLLAIPVLFLIFFMYVFRRMGGAGSAMSFGRSRGKLFAQEDIEFTFQNVAGIDEAVNELREVVEFLRTPGKYQALGGRIPRGVLLVGPPGTGKTLLAKAVAGEAGVPFFSLSGSDFVEMYVGVGAARVRDIFQQAGQKSPSIIFIDELDALGKVRGSGLQGGHDEREQTLNALLVEMDGFSSDQSVIVMGATNRPETLDPALLRPGRFDRHVMVDRPDVKGREAILKVHAAKIKMDNEIPLARLARLTPGFVGADLANLVNEAALLAARNNKPRVTMVEFEEAIERLIAGLEKHTRIIHEDEKQRVAYHECGHALVACSLPNSDPVHKISIIPRGMAMGYAIQLPEGDRRLVTQSELQGRICVLLGGILSEEIVYKETSTGAQNDLQRATDYARQMVTEYGMSPKMGRVYYSDTVRSAFLHGSGAASDMIYSPQTLRDIDLEIKRLIDDATETVRDILTTRRAALDQMTRELIECEVMDADRLKRILDQHKRSPQLVPGTQAMKNESEETEGRNSSHIVNPSDNSASSPG